MRPCDTASTCLVASTSGSAAMAIRCQLCPRCSATWLASSVLRPDDPTMQLELLAKMVASMSDQERQCVVMYDEMDIMKVATYDQQLDQVLGPHKRLQQFLVGGTHLTTTFDFESDALTTRPRLLQYISAFVSHTIATFVTAEGAATRYSNSAEGLGTVTD